MTLTRVLARLATEKMLNNFNFLGIDMKLICGLIFLGLLLQVNSVWSMQEGGCGAGDCRDCHVLTKPEAQKLLSDFGGKVVDVKLGEVPGLWDVYLEREGQTIPLFVDFSKEYLITGKIIKLATREDVAYKAYINLNRVDAAAIPLDDAIVIGNPQAARKVIVFDDPECKFCKKLHPEMQQVVAKHKDIAFFIKMYPLKMHPKAYDKAKAIICAKSAKMLADSLKGREIPKPSCETDQVDKNIELAGKLGIKSTPTLIFPDGRVFPGFRDAEAIVKILNEKVEP